MYYTYRIVFGESRWLGGHGMKLKSLVALVFFLFDELAFKLRCECQLEVYS